MSDLLQPLLLPPLPPPDPRPTSGRTFSCTSCTSSSATCRSDLATCASSQYPTCRCSRICAQPSSAVLSLGSTCSTLQKGQERSGLERGRLPPKQQQRILIIPFPLPQQHSVLDLGHCQVPPDPSNSCVDPLLLPPWQTSRAISLSLHFVMTAASFPPSSPLALLTTAFFPPSVLPAPYHALPAVWLDLKSFLEALLGLLQILHADPLL